MIKYLMIVVVLIFIILTIYMIVKSILNYRIIQSLEEQFLNVHNLFAEKVKIYNSHISEYNRNISLKEALKKRFLEVDITSINFSNIESGLYVKNYIKSVKIQDIHAFFLNKKRHMGIYVFNKETSRSIAHLKSILYQYQNWINETCKDCEKRDKDIVNRNRQVKKQIKRIKFIEQYAEESHSEDIKKKMIELLTVIIQSWPGNKIDDEIMKGTIKPWLIK